MRDITTTCFVVMLSFGVGACSSDSPETTDPDTTTADTQEIDPSDSEDLTSDDGGVQGDVGEDADSSDQNDLDTAVEDADPDLSDLPDLIDTRDATLTPEQWPCGTPGPLTHRVADNGQLLGWSPHGHFYLLHLDGGAYALSPEDGAVPVHVSSQRHDLSRFEFSPNDEWAINRSWTPLPVLLSTTGATPPTEFTLLETDRVPMLSSFDADSERVLVQTPEGFSLLALPDLDVLIEFDVQDAVSIRLAPSGERAVAWVAEGEVAVLKVVDLTEAPATFREIRDVETILGFVSNTTDRLLLRTETASIDYIDLASDASPQQWLQLPEGRTAESVSLQGGWVEVASEDEERDYTEFFAIADPDDLPTPVPGVDELGRDSAVWSVGPQGQAAVILDNGSEHVFLHYASAGAEPTRTVLPEGVGGAIRTFAFSPSEDRFGVGMICALYVADTAAPADGVWAPLEDCAGNFSWQFAGDTSTVLYGSGRNVSYWDTDNPDTAWDQSFGTIREMVLSRDGQFFATRDSRTPCDDGCNQSLKFGPVCDGATPETVGSVRSGVSGSYLFPTDSTCLLFSREDELFAFVPGDDDLCP